MPSQDLPGCPAVRRAGCPIRRPPDPRLPAPPRGVSPRGRVLRRPPTPRHPPCAHLRGHSHGRRRGAPNHRVRGPDRRAPQGPTGPLVRRHPVPDRCRRTPPDRRPPFGNPVWQGRSETVFGVVRADGEARSLLARPRPRGLGDPTRRVVKVLASEQARCRCGRTSPRWSRGGSNPGPPPCKGGALPAELRPPGRGDARVGAPGLEPGASALSGPRSDRLSYAPMQQQPGGLRPHLARDPIRVDEPLEAGPAAPKTEQTRVARAEQLKNVPHGSPRLRAMVGAPAGRSTRR